MPAARRILIYVYVTCSEYQIKPVILFGVSSVERNDRKKT
ncbi:Uncharacterized protein dnm_061710 [Desulfonema magnum]|uniref:Uncharacterized protein n=1 Tax=Desulfonema magnum TaxID=45655 RepID=A0A975BR86_9BACT|nr:Uncharacterized protein dnm_061710 [Desulfonema magnum]